MRSMTVSMIAVWLLLFVGSVSRADIGDAAEVESVIQELSNVRDVTVRGQPHPIVGQIVTATVTLKEPEPKMGFTLRLKKHCAERGLQPFKVPVKVAIVDGDQFGSRFKRMRGNSET